MLNNLILELPETLPQLINREVCLKYLNSKQYNGNFGRVIGFHTEKQRYAVKMYDSGKIKLFKAKNIDAIPRFTGKAKVSKKLDLFLEPENLHLKKGLKIFDWLEKHRREVVLSEKEIKTKLYWLSSMKNKFVRDLGIIKKLAKIAEDLLPHSIRYRNLYFLNEIRLIEFNKASGDFRGFQGTNSKSYRTRKYFILSFGIFTNVSWTMCLVFKM
jgi:hypothetical protein